MHLSRGTGRPVGADVMNVNSFFAQVLGFIEEANIAAKWNYNQPSWNQPSWSPANNALAATKVSAFICPSNAISQDQFGGTCSSAAGSAFPSYGRTDYLPGAYTDISPVDGTRQKNPAYKGGTLSVDQSTGGPCDEGSGTKQIINNYAYPVWGGTTCSWMANNCGPNDEPFSQHSGGGVYVGFADGSVKWLSQTLDVQTIRQIADPSDGGNPTYE